MKKLAVLFLFMIFVLSCSSMKELQIVPYESDLFAEKVKKLVENLDNNLKSLNYRSKKLKIKTFNGDSNIAFKNILIEKIKNELFLRGYILTEDDEEIELEGKYFILRDSIEVFLELKYESIIISSANEKIPLNEEVKQIVFPDVQDFVSLER